MKEVEKPIWKDSADKKKKAFTAAYLDAMENPQGISTICITDRIRKMGEGNFSVYSHRGVPWPGPDGRGYLPPPPAKVGTPSQVRMGAGGTPR